MLWYISPKELVNTNNKTPILVASDLTFPYIHRQLKELSVTNVHDCDFIFAELDLELEECNVNWSKVKLKQKVDLYLYDILAQKNKKTKLNIKAVDLVLTEKCSLKCDGCSNLMQYYAKPIDEDFEQCIRSIDTFLSTIDHVQEIRVIGGEPLMYKRVDEVIKHLYNYDNYGKIQINTNKTQIQTKHKTVASCSCWDACKTIFANSHRLPSRSLSDDIVLRLLFKRTAK